jgi:hypothetical protein
MRPMNLARFTLAPLAVLLLAGNAHAVPISFFGEDLTPGGVVPPGGNAETARDAFTAGLVGVGTEDFESFTQGDPAPINLSFPGSSGNIGATLTGGGLILGPDFCGTCAGRFPTSGDNLWNVEPSGGDFNIAFDSPISAFGFYGTDIGDFGGQITLELVDGGIVNLVVPNTVGAPDGSLLFYGFIDADDAYTSITFGNTSGADGFGFDDMIVGDRQQIIPVPEPSAALLFAAGALLVGSALRRRG